MCAIIARADIVSINIGIQDDWIYSPLFAFAHPLAQMLSQFASLYVISDLDIMNKYFHGDVPIHHFSTVLASHPGNWLTILFYLF